MSLSVDAIYGLGVSHNKYAVPLPDGTYYPEWATPRDNRALQFLTHFDRIRDKPWADCTFLDLGCSEGSTTFGLSQTGATVFGVEGRADGIDRANVLRNIISFDKTFFSVGNVDEESSYRPVDGIFNCGILYHLSNPIRCLEQSAKNARLFVYIDTGHAPRSDEERRNSKFTKAFGKPLQLDYQGLKVDAVEFAEPTTPEKDAKGIRRKPRSAIGNSTSVWLAHSSMISVMAKLGFPYHETLTDYPKIPRLRTCFFRSPPKAVSELEALSKPLPAVESPDNVVLKCRQRDLKYLKGQRRPVLVIGREPMLSRVVHDLTTNGIKVSSSVAIPGTEGDPYSVNTIKNLIVNDLELGVAAVTDVIKLTEQLMRLDKFKYVFSSFALAHSRGLA